MDLDALRFANFKLLDEAVSDWSRMVDNLDDLKESAGKGLAGAAKKANWAGYNATVSREFIGKTAAEFEDALTQARTTWKILRDTRDELRKHSEELVRVIAAGLKKNLTVKPTSGGGFTVSMNVHPDRAAKGSSVPDHGQRDVDALRDDVQRILDKATESDTSASMVLQAIADQSTLGFSGASYSDRDGAVAAVKEADALSKLAKKNPSDLSVAEFDRLNASLKKYADDGLFSERFATNLGAKGTLEFWANINDPNANPQLNHARHEKFDDLQKNLSLTLATATQSDSLGMTEWTSKVVDLGNRPIGNSGPAGFQVMSNLMRWGDFDDQFLTDYGSKLIETEKKLTGNGEGAAWRRTGTDLHLNRTGSDTGWDPMTGYLKGLSSSPDAATSFFNSEFISKGDAGNPFEREVDGKSQPASLSNFQYLFEEREWPAETNSKGESSDTGRNNLALALEAAATGHPAGEMPTADTPPHNAEQAKLVESIFSSVSRDSNRLTDNGYMSDSMGQIAAEYMPDIHRGLHPGTIGEKDLFPVVGSSAQLGEADITRFLYTVGRNPEGYAAVNLGQHSYTASIMEYHFKNPGEYINDPDFTQSDNLKKTIEDIARVGGEIEGTIGAGRAYEAELEAGAKDSDYNKVMEKVGTWGGTAVGIGIGLGTAPLIGPGGVVVGGVTGTAADQIIGSLVDGAMKDSSGEVLYRNGQELNGTRDSTYRLIEESAKAAGERSKNSSPHIVVAASAAAEQGFGNAHTNIKDYIEGQGIPGKLG
ncbi:hypothetical protein AB0H82_18840 [Streptomyces sp. NPDC050732]|uniref:hypothetical protein n=1 Tax=Streptomyces sp. NPDC050732 TaxID=3154632 RepID=UPI0034219C69